MLSARASIESKAPFAILRELVFTLDGLQEWFCPVLHGELSEAQSIRCHWPGLGAETELIVSERNDQSMILGHKGDAQFQSIELREGAGSTSVTVSHHGLPDDDLVQGTRAGWEAALLRLDHRAGLKSVWPRQYEAGTFVCASVSLLDCLGEVAKQRSFESRLHAAPHLSTFYLSAWSGLLQTRVFRPSTGLSIAAVEAWAWGQQAIHEPFLELVAELRALVGGHAGSA